MLSRKVISALLPSGVRGVNVRLLSGTVGHVGDAMAERVIGAGSCRVAVRNARKEMWVCVERVRETLASEEDSDTVT